MVQAARSAAVRPMHPATLALLAVLGQTAIEPGAGRVPAPSELTSLVPLATYLPNPVTDKRRTDQGGLSTAPHKCLDG